MSHFRSTTHARLARIALRIALTLALAFGLVLLFANSEKAKTVYEITLDDTTYTVESYSDEMDDVLDEAGLELSASDCIDTAENQKKDTVEVSITHKQYVTVTCDGAAVSVLTDEGEDVYKRQVSTVRSAAKRPQQQKQSQQDDQGSVSVFLDKLLHCFPI